MKIGFILLVSFLCCFQLWSQDNVFRLTCIEGDTLLNDPACWWCTSGVEEIFCGIEVFSPSNRKNLIRHPFNAETRGASAFIINYEADSTMFFEMVRVDTSTFKTSQEWVDYLNACPECVRDDDCCPVIDSFYLSNDTLCISLSSMDSVVCVQLPDSISPPQFIEQFELINDTLFILLSEDTLHFVIIPDGGPHEHDPQLIDTFEIRADTLFISITEDDSTWFVILPDGTGGGGDTTIVVECCDDCRATLFREYFSNISTNQITVTVNGGSIPDDTDYLWVMREGDKMMEGPPGQGDYTISGSDILFNYSMVTEDLEVWMMVDTLWSSGPPVPVYREYFLDVSGNSVMPIQTMPPNPNWIKVWVEGVEQRGNYDYFINGASIDFTYPLISEDVEIWFIEDTRCNLLIFQQYFNDVSSSDVVLTANGGVFPALRQSIVVWVEGYKQQEGPTGDYEIVGSTVEFKYVLDNEDVEIWFISGLIDVGALGLFQDN